MWKISIASSNIDRYYQTQQDIKDLTLENNLLENEIAKQSSLRIIEQEASRAGFSEVKKVEWIK